jgi:hypothetical protein
MDPRLIPLDSILKLNTQLFGNCLDGVDDATANRRPSDVTNSMAFIACHLVESRHFLATYLGRPTSNAVSEALKGARGIGDVKQLPPLTSVLAAWGDAALILDRRFSELGDAELSAPSPRRFPVDDGSILGGIAFLIQHESYHVGQLALLRKYYGLPAMRYG